jgi:hypothetical protein
VQCAMANKSMPCRVFHSSCCIRVKYCNELNKQTSIVCRSTELGQTSPQEGYFGSCLNFSEHTQADKTCETCNAPPDTMPRVPQMLLYRSMHDQRDSRSLTTYDLVSAAVTARFDMQDYTGTTSKANSINPRHTNIDRLSVPVGATSSVPGR